MMLQQPLHIMSASRGNRMMLLLLSLCTFVAAVANVNMWMQPPLSTAATRPRAPFVRRNSCSCCCNSQTIKAINNVMLVHVSAPGHTLQTFAALNAPNNEHMPPPPPVACGAHRHIKPFPLNGKSPASWLTVHTPISHRPFTLFVAFFSLSCAFVRMLADFFFLLYTLYPLQIDFSRAYG